MSYIRTFKNNKFDYVNIENNVIDVEEIASVLAKIPRWLGHTKKFYSVAQHCCWCHDNTKGDKLEALMHDASEAYVGDCPTPLKNLLPNFQKIENKIQHLLADHFKYNYPFTKETHEVDKEALSLERMLIKQLDSNYEPYKIDIIDTIDYWDFNKAKKEFLKRFNNVE